MDRIQSQKVICTGGLNTSENFLLLSDQAPGAATQFVNFETSLSGGYRRINGYALIDQTYGEVTNGTDVGEGPVLGIWGFVNSTNDNFEIIAARKKTGVNEYKFYLFDSGTGWTSINTGTTQSDTGVTRVRAEIFMTVLGNNICFVDGENKALVYDGTTWYQLDSANTGGSGDPGGDQVLDAPSVVTYFKETLFLSGDSNFPAVVAYSAPGDPLTWTAAAGGGQLVVGFPVQQIKAFRDENYIFGVSAIKKALADEAVGFVTQNVTTNLGCIARDSVVEVGGSLLFLSPDGIRPIAGTDRIGDVELNIISQPIHNTIKNIVDNYTLSHINGCVIRSKTQFRYFISGSNFSKEESYGLLGCSRTYSDGVKWEFGELRGFQSNACWSGYDELGMETIYHGDFDGNVYIQEVGNTLAGDDMTSVYTTPFLDFGDTEIRKEFRVLNIFVRAEGSLSADIAIRYDWNRGTAYPNDYNISSSGTLIFFDQGYEFDDGNLFNASSSQPVFPINIQGSAYSIQVSIVSQGNYAPYTIQGIVYELSVKGRE